MWFPFWVNLDKFTDGHSRCRIGCMDGKRDLHIHKGPHHRFHDIHPMEQKGDNFPSLRHKIQAYQDNQKSEKVLQWGNTFQFAALPVTQTNQRKRAPGKIRARWSSKSRNNPMKTKRPNTPETSLTNMDMTDTDKAKAPLSVKLCERLWPYCQFCKQSVPHPLPQESYWRDEDWTGGHTKTQKPTGETNLLSDWDLPSPKI